MSDIGISTDYVCDLPEEYLRRNKVGIIYFYIITNTGRFKDVHEITSENMLEYLDGKGGEAITVAPSIEEYCNFFKTGLSMYDEVIHICVSRHISQSYENAIRAVEKLGEQGKKVYVVDSGHLSTGLGHMVIKAVEWKDKGQQMTDILNELEKMKQHISTSFITVNADYLYLNKRVNKWVRDLCSYLTLHPVLAMKDGKIVLKKVFIGNYEKAALRYVRGEVKRNNRINKSRAFITHVGCGVRFIGNVKDEVEKLCQFEELISTKASATISGNCGMGTFGILYVYNYGG